MGTDSAVLETVAASILFSLADNHRTALATVIGKEYRRLQLD